jgi:hypothetical protein
MQRIGTVLKLGFAVSSLSCLARDPAAISAPISPLVVLIPSLADEADAGGVGQVGAGPTARRSACPQGTFAEQGRCIQIIASDEIPVWTPPTGHLDPCATLTSDQAVYGCDPQNEYPADGGTGSRARSR